MKASIGIITPPRTKGIFQLVEEQMRQRCDITYLTYSTTMELTALYQEQASRFDGFLFSGAFPRDYIMEYVCPITKPHRYLKLSERDYYRAIARIYARDPHTDFSRVMFDCERESREELNRVFEDVFAPDQIPRLAVMDRAEQKGQVHRKMLEHCRQIWRQGEVDLVVTRMSNLGPMLEQEGIPCKLLQPGTATVLECFAELLGDIQSVHMERALTACCVIQPAHETPLPEELALLEKALERFNAEQNRSFMLRREGICYDAITSGAAARELTCGYTGCLLTQCLMQALPFSVCVGWGMGYDLVTAHQNALRALREVQRDAGRNTYLVNESYEMVGPLCGERTIRYQIRSEPRVNQLAKKLGVSPVNLEKLISLQEKKGMSEFSVSDLVFYLDITPRSAARILRKLEDSGNAVQISRIHLSGRGRPAAIYRIDLKEVPL